MVRIESEHLILLQDQVASRKGIVLSAWSDGHNDRGVEAKCLHDHHFGIRKALNLGVVWEIAFSILPSFVYFLLQLLLNLRILGEGIEDESRVIPVVS